MFEFKVRATPILGAHKELTIFTRGLPSETWAHCGVLRMTEYEADAFKAAFKYGEWEDAKPSEG